MQSCNTTIRTRINARYIATSVYRLWQNEHFQSWGWETIVWDVSVKPPDIVEQLTETDANEVVRDHKWLFDRYRGKEQ